MPKFSIKNKWLKLAAKVLAATLGIYLLLLTIIYTYITINKKEVIGKITSILNEKLQGTVGIKDMDITLFSSFPSFAVRLQGVTIKDSMFAQHDHYFLQAGKAYAKLGFFSLIKLKPQVKEVAVEDASIYLYKDSTGYTTEYLLKPKQAKGDSASLSKQAIPDIELSNVRFTKNDEQQKKLLDFSIQQLGCSTEETKDGSSLSIDHEILVHSLSFNLRKGSFIKGKKMKASFEAQFNTAKQLLQFEKMETEIDGQLFVFNGLFSFAGEPSFKIGIATKEIEYDFAKTLVTEGIAKGLSNVSAGKLQAVEGTIEGPLNYGEPLIQLTCKANDTKLGSPLIQLEHARFNGSFTNQFKPSLPNGDENTRIELKDFSAQWNGLTFTSKSVVADDLSFPIVTTSFQCSASFEQLNNVLGSYSIQLIKGSTSMNLNYHGPLFNNKKENTFVTGSIGISNGEILYGPKNVPLKNCNGSIIFQGSDVVVKQLKTNVLGNDIEMNGLAKNIVNIIDTDPSKVDVEWNISSPTINLEQLVPLFANDGKLATNKNKAMLSKTAKQIDSLLAYGNLVVTAQTPTLVYQKFLAKKVLAKFSLQSNQWKIKEVSLEHAGGQMSISGILNGISNGQSATTVSVRLNNMDIHKLLYAFNDFGQLPITHKNLQGRLTATANIAALLDRKMEVLPSSINGTIDFSVKQGKLIRFEPLYKVQQFIFKKRDFDTIDFAELKDRMIIKDRDITINRMEIQSSAFSFFVQGIYSMKGNTDISVQVPLSNLKKRKADYKPTNNGVNRSGGMSIFLKAKEDKNGEIKIDYDPFGRFRKQYTGKG